MSRVDVEKLKAQRKKERLMTARQSVRMMQSLEETLRNALEMRGLEMNPDDPNQIEDDWVIHCCCFIFQKKSKKSIILCCSLLIILIIIIILFMKNPNCIV